MRGYCGRFCAAAATNGSDIIAALLRFVLRRVASLAQNRPRYAIIFEMGSKGQVFKGYI